MTIRNIQSTSGGIPYPAHNQNLESTPDDKVRVVAQTAFTKEAVEETAALTGRVQLGELASEEDAEILALMSTEDVNKVEKAGDTELNLPDGLIMSRGDEFVCYHPSEVAEKLKDQWTIEGELRGNKIEADQKSLDKIKAAIKEGRFKHSDALDPKVRATLETGKLNYVAVDAETWKARKETYEPEHHTVKTDRAAREAFKPEVEAAPQERPLEERKFSEVEESQVIESVKLRFQIIETQEKIAGLISQYREVEKAAREIESEKAKEATAEKAELVTLKREIEKQIVRLQALEEQFKQAEKKEYAIWGVQASNYLGFLNKMSDKKRFRS